MRYSCYKEEKHSFRSTAMTDLVMAISLAGSFRLFVCVCVLCVCWMLDVYFTSSVSGIFQDCRLFVCVKANIILMAGRPSFLFAWSHNKWPRCRDGSYAFTRSLNAFTHQEVPSREVCRCHYAFAGGGKFTNNTTYPSPSLSLEHAICGSRNISRLSTT